MVQKYPLNATILSIGNAPILEDTRPLCFLHNQLHRQGPGRQKGKASALAIHSGHESTDTRCH